MDLSAIWLCVSLLLCLAELVLPGQVSLGLGLSGLLVSLLLWAGIASTWPVAALATLVLSIPIVLMVRAFCSWLMPGDTAVQSTDEDGALEGQVVRVVETIEPGRDGRVAFGDSSWPAMSNQERLEAGQLARLHMRAGLVWVVVPVDSEDLPAPLAGDHPGLKPLP